MTYTAIVTGSAGNVISVAYVASGVGTTLSVAVAGNAITVNLGTDGTGAATSTAADVLAAVEASGAASALVSVALATGQDGSGVPGALAVTSLSGAAETICGVLQEAALEGESCDVVFVGVSRVEAGAAFSAGDVLAADGVGRSVHVNSSPAAAFLAAGAALALTDAAGTGDLPWALIGPRPQRVGA